MEKIGTGLNIIRINTVEFKTYAPIIAMIQILQQHFHKSGLCLIAVDEIMEQASAELASLPLIGNVEKCGYI